MMEDGTEGTGTMVSVIVRDGQYRERRTYHGLTYGEVGKVLRRWGRKGYVAKTHSVRELCGHPWIVMTVDDPSTGRLPIGTPGYQRVSGWIELTDSLTRIGRKEPVEMEYHGAVHCRYP